MYPTYHCENFNLAVKSYPPNLTGRDGTVQEDRLGCPWLPRPARPSTHERRHLRNYQPPPPEVIPEEFEKWTTTAADLEKRAQEIRDPRPVLRHFMALGKKRIHKHAVARSKVRRRLVFALRTVLHQLQREHADDGQALLDALDLKRNILYFSPNLSVYLCPMSVLITRMREGILRATNMHRPGSTSRQPQLRRPPQSDQRAPATQNLWSGRNRPPKSPRSGSSAQVGPTQAPEHSKDFTRRRSHSPSDKSPLFASKSSIKFRS